MVDTKITHPRDGRVESKHVQHENSSPKDGELNGRHENNSYKGWTAQNNSPNLWTDRELYGRHENNSLKEWTAQK